jgi:hypothetical protein
MLLAVSKKFQKSEHTDSSLAAALRDFGNAALQ